MRGSSLGKEMIGIVNLKKIVPVTVVTIYGYFIAYWTFKENYFLLLVIFIPVFILGAVALVLESPHSTPKAVRCVKLPSHTRYRMIYRLTLIYIIGVFSLNLIAQANPTPLERILASVILILGFIPTFFYIKHGESGIPFLPLFGAIYSIYFGLPIFLLEDYTVGSVSLSQGSLEKALLLAASGLLILYLSYYKRPGKSIGKHLPRISIYWNTQKARFWAVLLSTLGMGVNYLSLTVHVPVRFQQLILFLTQLSMIGIGILFILQLQGRLNKAGKALLWCVFLPSLLMLRLGTGAIAQVLLIIIFMSLTYWCFRRKIPWKAAVIGMLMLIILIGARGEFRKLTWKGNAEESPIEKSMLFAELAFTDKNSPYLALKFTIIRLAHILSFAHVVEQTPEDVPYWNGKTYLTLLWTPIPRILYPEKPTKELGQEFGHRYSLLNPYDYTTSYNLPQIVEMYANFGIVGVIIGMFLIGIIYRSLYEMFSHRKAGEGGVLIGLILFTNLSNIESDFSLVFGGLFYHTLLIIIINMLIKRKSNLQ